MKKLNQYRYKLTIYLFLLVLIPLLVTSIITLSITNKEIEQGIFTKNSTIVEGLKNTISAHMNSIESTIIGISKTDEITSMKPENMDSLLKEMRDSQLIISQLNVTDKTGMQIYKTAGELSDRSDREYFKKAIAGENYYSDVLISGTSGKPIVVYAVPIEKDGEIVGTLGASIELSFISELANSIKVSEKGYGYAVDSKGIFIAYPDQSKVEDQEDASTLEPVAKAISGQTGTTEYTYEGEIKLAAYTYIENTNWGLVVQQPSDEAFAESKKLSALIIFLIVLASVIAIVIAIMLANSATKPLEHIQEQMAKAKEGNLIIQLPAKITKRKDEFGLLARNFVETMASIGIIIGKSKNVTDDLNFAASELNTLAVNTKELSLEITSAVEEIAKGATDQASDSEKSARLTEAFDDKFKDLLSKSQQMNSEVVQVTEINSSSKMKMSELEQTSKESKESTKKVEEAIKELELKSSSISEILDTITSISAQTNLLALNASIEAARAGEHGKGFAVVAEEIRKLAEGSSDAAKDIGDIIGSIKTEINQTVGLMSEVTKVSEEQIVSVSNVNEAFNRISNSVNNISSTIISINDSVKALSKDNALIVDSITSISSVSEETAAAAEEVSASVIQQLESVEHVAREAKRLQKLSIELKEDIEVFEI